MNKNKTAGKTLSVYFNKSEYFIATSKEAAEEQLLMVFGPDYIVTEENEEPMPFEALLMDTKLTLPVDNGVIADEGGLVEKTCAEWISISGPGYLASVDR